MDDHQQYSVFGHQYGVTSQVVESVGLEYRHPWLMNGSIFRGGFKQSISSNNRFLCFLASQSDIVAQPGWSKETGLSDAIYLRHAGLEFLLICDLGTFHRARLAQLLEEISARVNR